MDHVFKKNSLISFQGKGTYTTDPGISVYGILAIEMRKTASKLAVYLILSVFLVRFYLNFMVNIKSRDVRPVKSGLYTF